MDNSTMDNSTMEDSTMEDTTVSHHGNNDTARGTLHSSVTVGPSADTGFDIRALEYVSHVDANLICSVCYCPFVTPVITFECQHVFCMKCLALTLWYVAIAACPVCRSSINVNRMRAAPRVLSNMVDDLMVKCAWWRRGCGVVTTRATAKAHAQNHCEYGLVPCPEPSCPNLIRRGDWTSECRHRPARCGECGVEVMELHLEVCDLPRTVISHHGTAMEFKPLIS